MGKQRNGNDTRNEAGEMEKTETRKRTNGKKERTERTAKGRRRCTYTARNGLGEMAMVDIRAQHERANGNGKPTIRTTRTNEQEGLGSAEGRGKQM
ncbi:hypothetical protein AB1N83_014112 [Pleurotus pulmonarius]